MDLNAVYDMVDRWESRLFAAAYEQPVFIKCSWCDEELQENDYRWVEHPQNNDKCFCSDSCLDECLDEEKWEKEQENE